MVYFEVVEARTSPERMKNWWSRSWQPMFVNDTREGTPMAKTRIPLSAAEEESRNLLEKLELSTAEIGLTVRTTNCLEERGIFTVRDLLNTTRVELLSISNFGEKTLDEVYRSLEAIGFHRPSSDVKPR